MYDDSPIDVTTLKYVLYARKSTDDPDRQLRSLPDQIDECKQLAARLGLRVVAVIQEKQSAKRPNQRPKFTKMLDDIKAGTYDAILAWHPDRLARNMREGGEVIDMIDEQLIKDLKFVSYTFTPDPSDKMLLGMAFVLSKQYSDKLSQDVTRGVRKRFVQEGKTPTPKYGYVNTDGLYRPDGSNFDLLCEAWQMRKDQQGLKTIYAHLHTNNFHRKTKSGRILPITIQKLSDIFRDPFNYGVLVQAGQEVDLRQLPGYDFEPVVSEEDFFFVQRYSRKSYFHTKKRIGFYPLKGMLKCAFCDTSMVIAPSTSGSAKKTRYLFCRCDNELCHAEARRAKRSCRMKFVFNFIYDLLADGLNLTEADYKAYYDGFKHLTEKKLQETRLELHRKVGMRKQVDQQITDLALATPKGGDSKAQEIIRQKTEQRIVELHNEQVDLDKSIADLKKLLAEPSNLELSLTQFLNLSKNAATKVKKANAIGKDIICRYIFLNLRVGNDEVVGYELREPFKTLLENRQAPQGGVSRGGENQTPAARPPA